ncbi:MAG: hypothetical protein IPJ20_21320 [Flammeovirgaceae bacterium]|nr:hypothetical protein [Flammeovirgaceae bacterium]
MNPQAAISGLRNYRFVSYTLLCINVLAALIILFGTLKFLSYGLGLGLEPNQKIVLSMGVTTRNLGASVAPLLSLPVADEKTIVIIVLGAPVMIGAALLHAKFIHR